jgi:quercetin dioxygenase-like cupin family protein
VTTVKVSSEDSAGTFSLSEHEHPPGFQRPLHAHEHAAEAVYVLEGEYTFWFEGTARTVGPGAVQFVPPATPHRFDVGPEGGKVVIVFSPPAMSGFYEAVAAAGAVGLSPEAERALSAEHGLRLMD